MNAKLSINIGRSRVSIHAQRPLLIIAVIFGLGVVTGLYLSLAIISFNP